ncbi:DNA-binding FadR family transcriptional regulator [Ectopseudomonas oleovorans]|jgi:DNA-binding FadR family transcriptional regulator|uniref:DNA-binding FadR family transcriptional regulator n=2 Tax=Ectopseudomonas TaxID=3236654 RepID=A0A397NFZ2_ECTOL|nr:MULTISPECIES: FadR/GntR family transcriptional regulator [Pseudomonas aeruginosa group]AVO54039.1 GntR family transcriptional regulator [Pseudomonas mendocina]RIA34429.1 DNA-binding FadR family transcriptional regulator [Pseudomonas oleovorans]
MDYQTPKPRKSMHARIVHELGMRIVSGRFKPDEKLPLESSLCEEYQVSRPVLREATKVLVAKGLVYSKPRVGTVVRPRSEWHLLDPDVLYWLVQSTPQSEFFNTLAGVRRILEPEIAAMAATTATEQDIAAIEDAYQRMEKAQTRQEMLQPDIDFHRAIAEATHNDLLAYMCNMLSLPLRESITVTNLRPNTQALSLPRHKAILTAIKNRDALGARHASLVQLDDTRLALDTVMNELTPL